MTRLVPEARGFAGAGRVRAAVLALAIAGGAAAPAGAAQMPTAAVRHLFDLRGTATLPMSLPTDVAVAADGRIYVVDSGNHRVLAFDADGAYSTEFGGRGTAPGRLEYPVGLSVGPEGRVYVADKGNGRIQVFDRQGTFVAGFPVESGGVAVAPVDVAPSRDGTLLYVTGNDNHRVMAFTPSGREVASWGGDGINEGQFRHPASVTVAGDGRIYVVDVLNTRVQVFDGNARLAATVGGWGVLPGQFFRPKGVALDDAQRVYVSDSYMNVIEVFDRDARFLYVVGRDGAPRRFSAPAGIAVGRGRLFVAEMLDNKVSVFALAP